MRIGIRCCIFTKFPAELSVGTKEYLEPVAPDMDVIFPVNFLLLIASTWMITYAQILNLCFFIIGNNPFLCIG